MRKLLTAALTVVALAAVAGPAQAAFPGANGRLAYVQGDVGLPAVPFGIGESNPDGTVPVLVGPTCQATPNARCPNNPSWSRDGTKLAFDRNGSIFTMAADGTQRDNFRVNGLVGLVRPAWDPTGTQLIFQGVDRQGKTNLYISAVNGSTVRQLTFAGGEDPSWGLNNTITFVRNGNIYVIGADGKNKRRITGKGGTQPDWSPHETQIVFVRSGNVYRVHTDGSGLKKLTGKSGYEPVWSPDSKRILFHRNVSGSRTIYSVNLEAGDLKTAATGQPGGRIVNVYSVSQQPVLAPAPPTP
jgi:Tol biopolymer transport system component